MSIWNPASWFNRKKPITVEENKAKNDDKTTSLSPGRVSEPDVIGYNYISNLKDIKNLVPPSFRTELIPLIRDLYKINPDVSIALEDMFKLANTGHTISFPNNTPEEANEMRVHILLVLMV